MDETPRRKADDRVLLLHAMMLMVAADGHLDPEELATLESYFVTLPDFRGAHFQAVLDDALKLMRRFDSARASLAALGELSSRALKDKAFLVAADIAMAAAGGEVDPSEDELLEAMQRVLQVGDDTARKIVEVLDLKYATA